MGKLKKVSIGNGHDLDIIQISSNQQNYIERPTVLIIHGWILKINVLQRLMDFQMAKTVFQKHHNVNIVQIRWSANGINLYQDAVAEVPKIAVKVAKFLDDKLEKDSNLWKSLVIVGHSLGSHIAGEDCWHYCNCP